MSVGSKTFLFCDADNIVLGIKKSLLSIVNELRTLYKAVYGQRREKSCSSAGGKNVVGACKIVAERLGAVAAHKYGAYIVKLSKVSHRILYLNFKVLGSKGVCQLKCTVNAVGNDYCAVIVDGRTDNILSAFQAQRRSRQLSFHWL